MSQTTLLRICILAVGIILIAAIFWFGSPHPKKRLRFKKRSRATPPAHPSSRQEPFLSKKQPANSAAQGTEETESHTSLLGAYSDAESLAPERSIQDGISDNPKHVVPGARPNQAFDTIISLLVAAPPGRKLLGGDIVVAAEKTGLIYGDLNIFHRLIEGRVDRGPIFSMASVLKPGSFDMAHIREMQTPALTFFLTLPGPLTALDAWEKMLPTVQRMAELLDAIVLDDQRNALGRQTIAQIRDRLRAYDRQNDQYLVH